MSNDTKAESTAMTANQMSDSKSTLYLNASITAKEHLVSLVIDMITNSSLTLEDYQQLVKASGQRVNKSAYQKVCTIISLMDSDILLNKSKVYAVEKAEETKDIYQCQSAYLISAANAVINFQKFFTTTAELDSLKNLFIEDQSK
jgi:hypothetical protein